MDVDDKAEPVIDEALYSRQLYVLGAEAMKRMQASTVLIVGLNGLGVEVAKNVVLAGVKTVTLHDNTPVAIADLGAQFFLRESDLGQPRAAVTGPRLAELNNYVPVDVYAGALTPEFVSQFGIIVIAGTVPMAEAIKINDAARAAGCARALAPQCHPALCSRAERLSASPRPTRMLSFDPACARVLRPARASSSPRRLASSATRFATLAMLSCASTTTARSRRVRWWLRSTTPWRRRW